MRLELKELNYKYPGSAGDVFQQLNCQVTEAGFHALFGPSGVGKTTLAKMITGDIREFAGEINLHRINHVLYTYNLERLPGWCCIREHLESITPKSNRQRMQDLVDSLGLQSCLNSRFAQLSLGQHRLALAVLPVPVLALTRHGEAPLVGGTRETCRAVAPGSRLSRHRPEHRQPCCCP